MNDTEKQLGGTGESEPKLSESEIIDLKKDLIENFLLDDVASAFALDNFPPRDNETDEQRHKRMAWSAAQVGVILGQNVMRPNSEWEKGVPQPEDFLPYVRLQGALRRSMQVPSDIAQLTPSDYPDEWDEWRKGLRPNPYLTESDIELLQANGYNILLEQ